MHRVGKPRRAHRPDVLLPKPPHENVERLPGDQLHRVVVRIARLPEIVDRNDVGVVEPRCRRGFAAKTGYGRRARRPHDRGQNLQSHGPVELGLHRMIDNPHAALAEDPRNPVALDLRKVLIFLK